jgi:hypothetical protein
MPAAFVPPKLRIPAGQPVRWMETHMRAAGRQQHVPARRPVRRAWNGFDLLAFCRWLRDEDVELAKATTPVLLRLPAA